MKSFDLDFESFFTDYQVHFSLDREEILLEMAEGSRPGGGQQAHIRIDEDDIKYLYQFLPEDWTSALTWRYGIGLMIYSKKRNDVEPDQSTDFHLNQEAENDIGDISFNDSWIHDRYIRPDETAGGLGIKKKWTGKSIIGQQGTRIYTGVDFGFNEVYKKLASKRLYNFDMGGTDFSKWEPEPGEEQELPQNAGYKPLPKDVAVENMGEWLVGHGFNNHYPPKYQELLNKYLLQHPNVKRHDPTIYDKKKKIEFSNPNVGQPTNPIYKHPIQNPNGVSETLSIYSQFPLLQHNYEDKMYKRLGDPNRHMLYPTKVTPHHTYTGAYDPSKEPHEQPLSTHHLAGQRTGHTHYNRKKYQAMRSRIIKKYGEELGAKVIDYIEKASEYELGALEDRDINGKTISGQPVQVNIEGQNITIEPEDIIRGSGNKVQSTNYAKDIASEAFQAQGGAVGDIVVKPVNKSAGAEGASVDTTMDIYKLYGTHWTPYDKVELEIFFPDAVHERAKELFMANMRNKHQEIRGEAIWASREKQRYHPTHEWATTDTHDARTEPGDRQLIWNQYKIAARQISEELIRAENPGLKETEIQKKVARRGLTPLAKIERPLDPNKPEEGGLLTAILNHKRAKNPDAEATDILVDGFQMTYPLAKGPDIIDKIPKKEQWASWKNGEVYNRLDDILKPAGEKVDPTYITVFVPLLYPGQVLPSKTAMEKKFTKMGTLGHSAANEFPISYYSTAYKDPVTGKVIQRKPAQDKHASQGEQPYNRNEKAWEAAMAGGLPPQSMFATERVNPDQIDDAENITYDELQTDEDRGVAVDSRGERSNRMYDKYNRPLPGARLVLKSIIDGVSGAIKQSHDPRVKNWLENNRNDLYQWAEFYLRNTVSHARFWHNPSYEEYLKEIGEKPPITGYKWRRNRIEDFVRNLSNRDLGFGTLRKRATGEGMKMQDTAYTVDDERRDTMNDVSEHGYRPKKDLNHRLEIRFKPGTADEVLDRVIKILDDGHIQVNKKTDRTLEGLCTEFDARKIRPVLDKISEIQENSEGKKEIYIELLGRRKKGERIAKELLGSIGTPANAQNTFFRYMARREELEKESQEGNRLKTSELAEISVKMRRQMKTALIAQAISTINGEPEKRIVKPIREILQMPEYGGLDATNAARVPESSSLYKKALQYEYEQALEWAIERIDSEGKSDPNGVPRYVRELSFRKDHPDAPTEQSPSHLSKDMLGNYGEASHLQDYMILMNSEYDHHYDEHYRGREKEDLQNIKRDTDRLEEPVKDEETYNQEIQRLQRNGFDIANTDLVDDAIHKLIEEKKFDELRALHDYVLHQMVMHYKTASDIRKNYPTIKQLVNIFKSSYPNFRDQVKEHLRKAEANAVNYDIIGERGARNPFIDKWKKKIADTANAEEKEKLLDMYNKIYAQDFLLHDVASVKKLVLGVDTEEIVPITAQAFLDKLAHELEEPKRRKEFFNENSQYRQNIEQCIGLLESISDTFAAEVTRMKDYYSGLETEEKEAA